MSGDPCPKIIRPQKIPNQRAPIKRKPKRVQNDFTDAAKEVIRRRSGGRCEAGTPVCTFRAVVFHHILRRSQGGKGTPANGMHLCNACHVHIHANVAEACENGWLARTVTM